MSEGSYVLSASVGDKSPMHSPSKTSLETCIALLAPVENTSG